MLRPLFLNPSDLRSPPAEGVADGLSARVANSGVKTELRRGNRREILENEPNEAIVGHGFSSINSFPSMRLRPMASFVGRETEAGAGRPRGLSRPQARRSMTVVPVAGRTEGMSRSQSPHLGRTKPTVIH